MNVVKPISQLILQFSELIQPLMELILNIIHKDTNFRQTRDLLLPRLISGQLDVTDLDIQVSEELS